MFRATIIDLNKQADRIGELTGRKHYIDVSYGQPRLLQWTDNIGTKEISPRLTRTQLYNWMNAFIAGAESVARRYENK